MVTMIIWSLVYRGFKFWSGQIKRCNGYHAHLEFSISWVQVLVRSNQRCNGYHAHLEFSISSSGQVQPCSLVVGSSSGQVKSEV